MLTWKNFISISKFSFIIDTKIKKNIPIFYFDFFQNLPLNEYFMGDESSIRKSCTPDSVHLRPVKSPTIILIVPAQQITLNPAPRKYVNPVFLGLIIAARCCVFVSEHLLKKTARIRTC